MRAFDKVNFLVVLFFTYIDIICYRGMNILYTCSDYSSTKNSTYFNISNNVLHKNVMFVKNSLFCGGLG